MAPMHRTRSEAINSEHCSDGMMADLPQRGPDEASMNDFRRSLQALDGVLRLHFAQDDEMYDGLTDTEYRRTSGTVERA